METKTCSKCHIEKPIKDFSFRKDNNKYRNAIEYIKKHNNQDLESK